MKREEKKKISSTLTLNFALALGSEVRGPPFKLIQLVKAKSGQDDWTDVFRRLRKH